MRLLVVIALLASLPLLPAASASVVVDLDQFEICRGFGTWRVCVSRDSTWYCYEVSNGRPPGIADCFQFIGP